MHKAFGSGRPHGAPSAVEAADADIGVEAGRARHHPAVRTAGFLSDVADQVPSFVVCGAIVGAGAVFGRPRLIEAGARMLAAVVTAAFLKDRVKAMVSRTRPRAVLDGDPYVLRIGDDPGKDEHSFPSGHTSGAVAAARAWARTYPDGAVWAYAGAAAIAVVQLPRGKHYPADLVAGMVVGIASEAVVAGAGHLLQERAASRKGRGGAPRSPHPAPSMPR